MFRRLELLFQRYRAVHERGLRAIPLGPRSARWGQIETVEKCEGVLLITGWLDAESAEVVWQGGSTKVHSDQPRADVVRNRGGRPDLGFVVQVPSDAAPFVLRTQQPDGKIDTTPIPNPSDPVRPGIRRRLLLAFLRDMMRGFPHFVRHALRPGQRAVTRAAIKRALRLDVASAGTCIDPNWFGPPETFASSARDVTIVMPVHNALSLLQKALHRVAQNTDLDWHLILVEDASTDPDLRPWLIGWVQRHSHRAELICNDVNKGFVQSVNIGLAHANAVGGSGPVVLLNSDAMVPPAWASRLIAPMADATVASVTPLSNAAEILSVPAICQATSLDAGEGDGLDEIAQRFGNGILPEVPTGVGFCMALSRAWLATVPEFDPFFGRGYGEEVDWCQKTRSLGARHLCQPRLFVEHVGGQSFGEVEKRTRIAQANTHLARRYPGFDADVQRFIRDDPLQTPRLALAVALAAQRTRPLPVFVGHALGGGADIALMAEVAQHRAAVILRVGGAAVWQFEVHIDGQFTAGQTDDLDVVRHLLAPVDRLALVYSCAVGHPDPVTLPAALLSLRRPKRRDTLEVRLHDYFPLSPSYTLLGSDGTFRGVPDAEDKDAAHNSLRIDGTPLPLVQWRKAWGALMHSADEVTAFSRPSAELAGQAYPQAHIKIRPHDLPIVTGQVRGDGDGRTIGALGNLNRHKGALVLVEMARLAPDQRFIVIGNVDSAIDLPRNVTVHGTYTLAEISRLAERYGIAHWVMPSIWPETFSFAVREALATGLHVTGFALGAQGEVLDQASNGTALAFHPQETLAKRMLFSVQDDLDRRHLRFTTAAE